MDNFKENDKGFLKSESVDKLGHKDDTSSFDWAAFNKEQNRKMKANTGKKEEGILKKMALTTEERFMIKDPTPSSHSNIMIPKRTILGSVLYFISAVYARLMKRR